MKKLNTPSYNSLIPRDRRIKSIQELYEVANELQTGGSSELSARVEALESLVSEGDNPTLTIDKFNEILDFLDGYDNTDSLVDLLAGKQDALTFNTAPSSSNKVATMADVPDVTGKADKVNNATSGNFAALDSNGNLTDSGHKHSDYLTSHQDISGKEDVTTIVAPVNATDATLSVTSLTCETGKYYRLDVPVETLAVTLPAMAANVTTTKTVLIYLTGGTTPGVTFSATDGKTINIQKGFDIKADEEYEINCLYNGISWVITHVVILNS